MPRAVPGPGWRQEHPGLETTATHPTGVAAQGQGHFSTAVGQQQAPQVAWGNGSLQGTHNSLCHMWGSQQDCRAQVHAGGHAEGGSTKLGQGWGGAGHRGLGTHTQPAHPEASPTSGSACSPPGLCAVVHTQPQGTACVPEAPSLASWAICHLPYPSPGPLHLPPNRTARCCGRCPDLLPSPLASKQPQIRGWPALGLVFHKAVLSPGDVS